MAPGLVTPEKAARGKRPTDVMWHTIVSPTGREKTGYPTQKPEGLLRRFVQASSRPGDLCLDPFAGSGTLGAVAAKLGRRYLLMDESAGGGGARDTARRRRNARPAHLKAASRGANLPTKRTCNATAQGTLGSSAGGSSLMPWTYRHPRAEDRRDGPGRGPAARRLVTLAVGPAGARVPRRDEQSTASRDRERPAAAKAAPAKAKAKPKPRPEAKHKRARAKARKRGVRRTARRSPPPRAAASGDRRRKAGRASSRAPPAPAAAPRPDPRSLRDPLRRFYVRVSFPARSKIAA